ncbi:Frigida-like [Trema orientale]|uniref:FRIGIDA-like protein n=1 Tax=Trema orientale TaxID=63057 RepID=A0A2P5F8J5_TREOI|nr:Frigida-like [Trema orientale]
MRTVMKTLNCGALLLEQLMAVCPDVGIEKREKAKNLALEWKGKMRKDGEYPLECLGFLHLVAAYGLASDFDMDELLDHFVIVVKYRQAVDLCRKICLVDKVEERCYIQEQLEMQKASRKGMHPQVAPAVKPTQPQYQLANHPDKEKQKQQSGKKRPRPDAPLGPTSALKTFRAAKSIVPSYQQPHLPAGPVPYVSSSAAPYAVSGVVQSAARYAGSSAGTYGLAGEPTGFPGNPSATRSQLYVAEQYVPSGYYDNFLWWIWFTTAIPSILLSPVMLYLLCL